MTSLWLALDRLLTVDKCSSTTLLSTCRRYEIIYFVYSENLQEILWITFIKTHLQIYSNLSNQSLNLITIYLFIFLTMTRDFESVESWTAHLLKSTASRRVFIISFDASVRSQNVAISWNINTSQQLRQWAIDQSDEIIKMLIELRDQRDMTLKLNEQWINVQVDHIKRFDELEINQMTIDTQEEIIVELWKKVLSLKKRQHSANQFRSRQFTESRVSMKSLSRQSIKNHTRRKSFTLFDNDHHKSFKFSNLSVFIDEDESTWDSWRVKMNDKLQTNVDHFDNENICIVYVISRLEDDAAEHIFAWHRHDALHSYILIYELFEHLKEIYNELNRNWKCRREYNVLRQTDKSFNVFYFDFMKLFSYLDYDDHILMNDLQNKINNRLQNALSVCSENFTSLTRLRIFLQDVNNKQRVNYQLRSQLRTVIVKVMIISDKHAATSLSVTTSIIDYVKSIFSSIFESARLSIICYTCKISSHLFKNCSQNKVDISASYVFILRLHEIIISKNKENEKMSSENSEAKN